MNNNAALALQFNNIVTMHSLSIVKATMEYAWKECDPQLIEETYEVWNDLISDVCKFVDADNV